MTTTAIRKYKVNIREIEKKAIDYAFSENRSKINEQGLSENALELKKTVIAIREAARLFVHDALESLPVVTPTDRREVEEIAITAIECGADCVEYLEKYCE